MDFWRLRCVRLRIYRRSRSTSSEIAESVACVKVNQKCHLRPIPAIQDNIIFWAGGRSAVALRQRNRSSGKAGQKNPEKQAGLLKKDESWLAAQIEGSSSGTREGSTRTWPSRVCYVPVRPANDKLRPNDRHEAFEVLHDRDHVCLDLNFRPAAISGALETVIVFGFGEQPLNLPHSFRRSGSKVRLTHLILDFLEKILIETSKDKPLNE